MLHSTTITIQVPESPIAFCQVVTTIYADMRLLRLIGHSDVADAFESLLDAYCEIAMQSWPTGGDLRDQLDAKWEQDYGDKESNLLNAVDTYLKRINALPPDDGVPTGPT